MYRGSNYDLFQQSLIAFIIIALVFVPFLRWAFTSKKEAENRRYRRKLKKDLKRLKRK